MNRKLSRFELWMDRNHPAAEALYVWSLRLVVAEGLLLALLTWN
jgi:hypothetical protein